MTIINKEGRNSKKHKKIQKLQLHTKTGIKIMKNNNNIYNYIKIFISNLKKYLQITKKR